MDCTHEWKGTADSVVCIHCGLKLTREEWLKTLEPEKPKAAAKRKKAKKTEK